MCIGVGSAGQLFHTNIAKKTKKSGYKCGFSVSISLKFVFNISRKVKEIIFEPKNAQHWVCFDHILEKAQMTPGSESATYVIVFVIVRIVRQTTVHSLTYFINGNIPI